MSQLLPTTQADDLQRALIDYLRTTFALADAEAQVALEDFLRHESDGIFKGPFVRVRLPFRPAQPGWEAILDWNPAKFVPYGHQAAAFARLSSRAEDGGLCRPKPTLVTTGTGSGKTEAFLYPIVDHVLRARAAGITGMKALILYPMNALANDQAQRLAGLLSSDPQLTRVTAALYTGEKGPQRTQVSSAGLITDRAVVRDQAPDILLTNYKMLDQLLLRHEDQSLWQQSAQSLAYLVLDEFHTYDGAQGTDVAMLLRRLGLALRSFGRLDTDLPGSDHKPAPPLGSITPVATSATLGDAGDPSAMVEFATTIFGEEFTTDAIVTESRQSLAEWADRLGPDLAPTDVGLAEAEAVNQLISTRDIAGLGGELARVIVGALFGVDEATAANWTDEDLAALVRRHPQVRAMVDTDGQALSLDDMAKLIFGSVTASADAIEFATNLIAALSHLRGTTGRDFVTVETHLWIRELSRIDRVADGVPAFRWSDDGRVLPADGADSGFARSAYPAIYCRHCGRSGWGVELAPLGNNLGNQDAHEIRAHHAAHEGRFRALIFAAREAAADRETTGLAWFDTRERQLLTAAPAEDSELVRDGWALPVLRLIEDPDVDSVKDQCPACDRPDGIRFMGSAIATLLSVSLSALFGAAHVDAREKKALVFTDSVQDAAHRAGFVENRSHTLTLRAAIRDAVDDEPISLDLLVDEMIRLAGDDQFRRYRLLPPDVLGRPRFDAFWSHARYAQVPNVSRQWARRRLLFDVICEFGVFSRTGRTLEATGAVAAEVDAGTPAALNALARAVLDQTDQPTLVGVPQPTLSDFTEPSLLDLAGPDEHYRIAWVRGVLEHLRTQGAIDHDWLSKYINDDGSRYRIWGGRARDQGMPAFPTGRTAPAFPRVGKRVERKAEVLLDSVTSPQSWYARWTGQVLGVEAAHGARLARGLLDRLFEAGLLLSRSTQSGGTAYALSPTLVTVAAVDGEARERGNYILRCSICGTEQYGSSATVEQLDRAPCLLVRCAGELRRAGANDNYYRRLYRADMRRVVAREHTSLLEDATRLAYENGFKAGHTDPSAPNVLVATPTLEMGIDIGDLSTVVLASLPRTVASYVQRVGRAGRITGNALDLVFVAGRGQNLPRLGDPRSLINGPVRPPATYLDAEEILQRQYLAAVVDGMARDPSGRHPARATAAMQTPLAGTFLAELIKRSEQARELTRFLEQFGQLGVEAETRLRAWATPELDLPTSSRLAQYVMAASATWTATVQSLSHRVTAIEKALPELQKRAASPAKTEDDERAARAAEASLRQTKGALAGLRGEYWIQVLEEHGLLPNYTLLSDNVTLDVAVSWLDPETQQYDSAPTTHSRPSGLALREFAPGATFYARGMEIQIDALDLGVGGESVHEWALCTDCGYARRLDLPVEPAADQASSASCPRCGSSGLADAAQRFKVVELTRVSAQAHRDEARINDRSDERRQTRFSILPAADIDPDQIGAQWFVDGEAFGARYLRRLTLRWFNVGRRTGVGAQRSIAGETIPANLFRVCVGCGVLDQTTRANKPDEHRAWCRYRSDTAEHTESLLLSRTLVTQGAVLPLPWSVSLSDHNAVPSLEAAILLGLRERFGGAPDHIGVLTTVDPSLAGENRAALLLHDLVPGGTGYLAELARPGQVYALLRAAWAVVSTCECQDEGRNACHRCLLPFAPPSQPDRVSRSSAERHLRELLVLGTGVKEPPVEMGWSWTREEPIPTKALESHLELHFRRKFVDLARSLTATVTEIPGPTGTAVQLAFPGSRTWLLEPQVNVLDSKPDFVLRSTDTHVPPMAIFTDGYAFHAAPAHRATLAHDASKRTNLADAGYVVLSVTAADLELDPPVPGWWSDAAATGLIAQAPSIVAWLPRVKEGPLGILRAWLLDAKPEVQTAWANVVPLMLSMSAEAITVDATPSLSGLAASRLIGEQIEGGDTTAYWWQSGQLGVLSRVVGGAVEMAAVLDDRAAAVDHHDYRTSWQNWLQLGNARQRATTATQWTTVSLAQGGTVAVAVDMTAEGTLTLSAGWAPALSVAETAAHRALLAELAAANVPPPGDVGEEIDGVLVDLSWPEQRLAVLYDGVDEALTNDFAALGWRLIAANAETIVALWKKQEESHVG